MKIIWNRSFGIDFLFIFIIERKIQVIEIIEFGVLGSYIQGFVLFSVYSVYYFKVIFISLIFVMFYYNFLDLMYLYMNVVDLEIKINL